MGKSIFAVNLPLKLFRATIANADIGSLKSFHTFLLKCLYHMLVKFEQNRMFQTTRNFELFDKKKKSCTKHGRPDQSQQELTVALRITPQKEICIFVIFTIKIAFLALH